MALGDSATHTKQLTFCNGSQLTLKYNVTGKSMFFKKMQQMNATMQKG